VLLVDDRTDPASREILRACCARDPRFRLLPAVGDGLVAALNTGLAEVRAPLVARFDADDLAYPGRLAAQVAVLQDEPQVALVGCRVRLLPGPDGSPGYQRFVDWQNALLDDVEIRHARFAECPIAHPTFAFRTGQVRELGGYTQRDWPEDLDLLCRLAESGMRLVKLPEVLHDWRDRPERLSRVDPRYGREAFLQLKAHYLARALPALCRGRRVLVWGAGRVGGRLGRYLLEAGVCLDGFIDIDPAKIGSTRHGLPILDGRAEADPSALREAYILAAVGGDGGRVLAAELLRRELCWLPLAGP